MRRDGPVCTGRDCGVGRAEAAVEIGIAWILLCPRDVAPIEVVCRVEVDLRRDLVIESKSGIYVLRRVGVVPTRLVLVGSVVD